MSQSITKQLNRVVCSPWFQAVMQVAHARKKILAARLLIMAYRDQRARKNVRGGYTVAGWAAHREKVDQRNTEMMKRIVDRHGWPCRTEVGFKATRAAWLMVQHADHDHMFQRRCLPMLEKAVSEGDADPRDLAYLTDRVLVAEGCTQIYGTQVFDTRQSDMLYKLSGNVLMAALEKKKVGEVSALPLQPLPIKDEASVDMRRLEIGLPSMQVYISKINRHAR